MTLKEAKKEARRLTKGCRVKYVVIEWCHTHTAMSLKKAKELSLPFANIVKD